MFPPSPRYSLHLGLTVALIGAGAGLAQNQYGPPPGPPGANGQPPSETPAAQATHLRQTLRLRADQEGALQAFIAAMQPPPGVMERMRRQEQSAASLPTPRRLDFILARQDEMRAMLVARMNATKRFYGQLTPSQQRSFDALQSTGGR